MPPKTPNRSPARLSLRVSRGKQVSGSGKKNTGNEVVEETVKSVRNKRKLESPVISPGKKRKSIQKRSQDGRIIDQYCWVCHNMGEVESCKTCKRVYHTDCLKKISKEFSTENACPECQLESVDGQKLSKFLTVNMLQKLLAIALRRISVINPNKYAMFERWNPCIEADHIVRIIDMEILEDKVNDEKLPYTTTAEFYSDVKWIHHNWCILQGVSSAEAKAADVLRKDFMKEILDLEACPECYFHMYSKESRVDNMFVRICKTPHDIVWAQLKGHPFWPAKCLKVVNEIAHVRYFGEHEMSNIPVKNCYFISTNNPKFKNSTLRGDQPGPKSEAYRFAKKELIDYIQEYEKTLCERFKLYGFKERYTYTIEKPLEESPKVVQNVHPALPSISNKRTVVLVDLSDHNGPLPINEGVQHQVSTQGEPLQVKIQNDVSPPPELNTTAVLTNADQQAIDVIINSILLEPPESSENPLDETNSRNEFTDSHQLETNIMDSVGSSNTVSIDMTCDVEQAPLDNSLDLQASYFNSTSPQPPHITSSPHPFINSPPHSSHIVSSPSTFTSQCEFISNGDTTSIPLSDTSVNDQTSTCIPTPVVTATSSLSGLASHFNSVPNSSRLPADNSYQLDKDINLNMLREELQNYLTGAPNSILPAVESPEGLDPNSGILLESEAGPSSSNIVASTSSLISNNRNGEIITKEQGLSADDDVIIIESPSGSSSESSRHRQKRYFNPSIILPFINNENPHLRYLFEDGRYVLDTLFVKIWAIANRSPGAPEVIDRALRQLKAYQAETQRLRSEQESCQTRETRAYEENNRLLEENGKLITEIKLTNSCLEAEKLKCEELVKKDKQTAYNAKMVLNGLRTKFSKDLAKHQEKTAKEDESKFEEKDKAIREYRESLEKLKLKYDNLKSRNQQIEASYTKALEELIKLKPVMKTWETQTSLSHSDIIERHDLDRIIENHLTAKQLTMEQEKNSSIIKYNQSNCCCICSKPAKIPCCGNTNYCSSKCQKSHYKVHIKTCQMLRRNFESETVAAANQHFCQMVSQQNQIQNMARRASMSLQREPPPDIFQPSTSAVVYGSVIDPTADMPLDLHLAHRERYLSRHPSTSTLQDSSMSRSISRNRKQRFNR